MLKLKDFQKIVPGIIWRVSKGSGVAAAYNDGEVNLVVLSIKFVLDSESFSNLGLLSLV